MWVGGGLGQAEEPRLPSPPLPPQAGGCPRQCGSLLIIAEGEEFLLENWYITPRPLQPAAGWMPAVVRMQ